MITPKLPKFSVLLSLMLLVNQAQFAAGSKILFTENKGQLADQNGKPRKDILFFTQQKGIQTFIGQSGIHYQWWKTDTTARKEKRKDALPAEGDRSQTYRVDINLLNAATPEVNSEKPDVALANYYLAQCPQGITGVKSYERVTAKNIYPNIDWTFYTSEAGEMEYDFIVRPSGNPSDIAMQVEGATKLSVSESGALVITSPFGTCEQAAPVAIQNGKHISSKFILDGNIIRFQLENYNPALALRIDPMVKMWGTYYGGIGEETSTDVKTDNSGNAYMAGYTTSASNISSGGFQNTIGGNNDGFLVKFNTAGQRLWATYYGGSGDDYIYGCALDNNGNLFISGTTSSSNAIAFNGFKNTTITPGSTQAFLAKLNANGVRQWGTYIGATMSRYNSNTLGWDTLDVYASGYNCATDPEGNVYLCGSQRYMDTTAEDVNDPFARVPAVPFYLSTPGAYQTKTLVQNEGNTFLVKFDGTGNRLWATYFGELPEYDFQAMCATDKAGNVCMAGTTLYETQYYSGINWAHGGYKDTIGGLQDGWLAKFDGSNSNLLWSTYYGSNKEDYLTGLCIDSANNIYINGTYDFPNGPDYYSNYAFLVKFDQACSRQWEQTYGAFSTNYSGKCAVSDNGYIVATTEANFNPNNVIPGSYCSGSYNAEGLDISRFTTSDGKLDWADVLKQPDHNYNSACTISPDGKYTYVADNNGKYYYGETYPNAFQDTVIGGDDSWLICYRDTAMWDTICGYVFDDQNANGVQDGGEGYLSNIRVWIAYHNSNYSPNTQTYTDSFGFYQFIIPKYGTSGSCYANLILPDIGSSSSSRTVVSMPLSGNYTPDIYLKDVGGCKLVFGVAPAISVSGNVYFDSNHDASLTSGEQGISWQSVSFNAQRQAFTDGGGIYNTLIPIGNYTETFDKGDVYSSARSNPANYIINGTSAGASFTNRNFGAYFDSAFTNSAVEVYQYGIPPVVGRTFSITARVSNLGTLPTSDTLIFHFDSLLTVTSPYGIIDNINHTITIITYSIVPGRYIDYGYTFSVPSNAVAGTVLHDWATVSSVVKTDIDHTNDTANDYHKILSSYDPNNKIVATNTNNPAEHIARNWNKGNDYITYTINFQNTGSYTALNVVINDTLPHQLDASTVKIISTSSSCIVSRDDNTLNFKFSSINLPDSADNPTGSKGYVVFKVKPAANAYPGDSIINHAAIYFDYNKAVITGDTKVKIVGTGPCKKITEIHKYDTICHFGYVFNNKRYDTSGVYRGDTVYSNIPGECGTDTILHLTINIDKEVYGTRELMPCDDFLLGSVFRNYYGGDFGIMDRPGKYFDTVVDVHGCITLATMIITPYAWNMYDTICAGDSLFFNNRWLKTRGWYIDTFQSACHTDSIVRHYLTINPNPVMAYFNIEKCPGATYNFYGRNLFNPGTYRDTLEHVGECGADSIVILSLYNEYFDWLPEKYISVILHPGESYSYKGITYTEEGFFNVDTIPGAGDCGMDLNVVLYITKEPQPDFTVEIWSDSMPNCRLNRGIYVHAVPQYGVPPYTYMWRAGSFTSTDSFISNGPNGYYEVTVTDSKGSHAYDNSYYYLADHVVTWETNSTATCNSKDSSGTFTVSLTEYWPYPHNRYPYYIIMSQGSRNDTGIIAYPNISHTFKHLPKGSLSFSVYDSGWCQAIGWYNEHTYPGQIDTGAIYSEASTLSGNCNSATVLIHVSRFKVETYDSLNNDYYHYYDWNSSPPYYVSYQAGGSQHTDTFYYLNNYDTLRNIVNQPILLTDANGCTKSLSVNTSGGALNLSIGDTVVSACGNKHRLTANIQGSASGYVWSTGVTTKSIIADSTKTYSVTVSDGSSCSTISSINITIPDLPKAGITISAASPGSICKSVPASFTAIPVNGGNKPGYKWYVNNTLQGSDSVRFIGSNLNNNDVITCELTSSDTCLSTRTATSPNYIASIQNNVTPLIQIASSDTTVCQGKPVTYHAIATSAGNTPQFQWKKGNNIVGGNTDTYIDNTATGNDTVTCMVTSSLTCASPSSVTTKANSLTIVDTVVPSVTLTAENSAKVCDGDTLIVNAVAVNGGNSPSFEWLLNGQMYTQGNNASVKALFHVNDFMNCYLVSKAACVTDDHVLSDTLKPQVLPLPQPSIILKSPDTLQTTEAYAAYQWYLAGVQLKNDTGNFYVPAKSGYYTVAVTDATGCSNVSSSFSYVYTGIKNADINVRIYPNPTNGKLYVEFSESGVRELSITNALGQSIGYKQQTQLITEWDVSALADGIYYLHIQSSSLSRTEKFVLLKR